MILSRAKHMIAGKLSRHGNVLISGSDTFRGIIAKAEVSYDRPTDEYTLLAAYNATINSGEIITASVNRYIPTKIEKPSADNMEVYQRGFAKIVNASGDLKVYVDPMNASTDGWDEPVGIDGTDYGWITKKTGVWANFLKITLNAEENIEIGQIESAVFLVTIPRNVNASITPVAEHRFETRTGRKWKVEDVDDLVYLDQSYLLRVVPDER